MNDTYDILIAPSNFGDCGSLPLDLLTQAGFKYKLNPYKRKLQAEELVALAKDCRGVIAGVEKYSSAVMSQLPKLKVISRCGVGLDSIELADAENRGIRVLNTPNGPLEPVAELTIALILDSLRGISRMDQALKRGEWQKFNGWLLHGKTVGIIGFGRIGKRVAELLKPFGVKILFFDPHVGEKDVAIFAAKKCDDLGSLLKNSDVITLHLNWDASQGPLLGSAEMSLLKPEAFIINVSRGEVLDENALYEVLSQKKIAGAALDVFSVEPYAGELTKLDNVILTPHIGSYAREAKFKMEIQAVKNLVEAFKTI